MKTLGVGLILSLGLVLGGCLDYSDDDGNQETIIQAEDGSYIILNEDGTTNQVVKVGEE